MPQAPILCIGAMWEARHVYWDAATTGELCGVPSRARRKPPKNFAEQSGIYVLYADFSPIYVGQCNKTLFWRLKMHHYEDDLAGRWDRFSWFGFRRAIAAGLSVAGVDFHISTRQLLDHLEALLIHSFEPPMNGQEGRFGKKVIRYKQIRDKRLGPDDRELAEMTARNGKFLDAGYKITKRGWKSG